MAKKQYFCILDTETTMGDTVADFAMIICDREGIIYNQCAVLVNGHYNTMELFHDKTKNDIWGYEGLIKRKMGYIAMLETGIRMIASVNAINKCANTGIDLSGFNSKFCLWQASVGNICKTKKYKQFCLDNHGFNNVTKHGNMTFKTNAEMVCGYINNNFIIEPHTALEDARDFELPILTHIIKKRNWQDNIIPYDWNKFQVRDNFKA